MKKLISIIAMLSLLLSLCACSRRKEEIKESITDMLTDASEAFTTERSTADTATTTERANEPTTDESTTTKNPTAAAEQETQVEVSETDLDSTNENSQMVETGKPDANAIAGFSALQAVKYTVPANTKGLSNKKICHSHGPASGGKPHYTVVEFQNTFDKYGALTLDRKSKEKVLYLTFDCGWEYENLTSKVLDTLKGKKVPAAFF
ncbi:MAG: polysaccharide deacetylase family protein, partial [Acutalibacteraceae bacterium]